MPQGRQAFLFGLGGCRPKFTLLRRKPRLRAEAHFGVQARALARGVPQYLSDLGAATDLL